MEKRVVIKPYSEKRLPKAKPGRPIEVSLFHFKKDLGVFDPEMKEKYSNKQIVLVMKLILKKAVIRIVKNLWRMPFPNGAGQLYMKEAQVSPVRQTKLIGAQASDRSLENLLRECQLGMKRAHLRWNKDHVKFSYKPIWNLKKSTGFFRSVLFEEIITRAEDPTLPPYRGHII